MTRTTARDDGTGAEEVRRRVRALLDAHDPSGGDPLDFLRARFDAGLAWVHFPEGLGGLGAPRALQAVVDAELAAAGAPDNDPRRIGIGLGMAAPTILRYGTEAQKARFLRPLWTGEEVWCQLFSEPGAGSDLAGLRTRAVREGGGSGEGDGGGGGGGDWIVDGQKVWTSSAHNARWAILIARTDPDVPKHQGITYFVCDMTDPGVEVRPLRQITGEAEFNEVFLTGVRIPDAHRLGAVGDGWRVAQATLMNERVAIGGMVTPREGGMIGPVAATWRARPELRTSELHDRLLGLWVEAEVARLGAERVRQQARRRRAGARGLGSETDLRPAQPADQRPGGRTPRRGRPALRRLDDGPPGERRLLRARRGLPLSAGEGQLDRGRYVGDPAQHRGRTGARAAVGTPYRQGRRLEGPPAMNLLYTEVEDDLRAAVRAVLADRCPPSAVLGRVESDTPYDPELWRTLAVELGLAGLLVPEKLGGQGASAREVAVVLEELGAAVAPVPLLGSAVLATSALLGCDVGDAGVAALLGRLAAGTVTGALAVPLSAVPGAFPGEPLPASSGSTGSAGCTGGRGRVADRARDERRGRVRRRCAGGARARA